ncbi:GCG_CRPN prefix-to-repeats domain-containing protein [Bradyrhizobium sp. Pa8]|uniref:GCG_CRPN prefix-to-repeats domain-containing protein n=1 Tax=Bradyrhizobium sp. Pa8 TaxID=3386552 RepID=UPI00403F9F29
MKYLFAAVMLASAVVGFSEAASAAGGCGPGWYRGAYGGCRPMRGPAVVVAPRAPVVVVAPRPRVCPYGFRWYAGRCRPF